MDEAGRDFEKAVAADPDSALTHLSLGVIRLFQYQNGVAKQPDARIAQQNATNAARAEEQLRLALQLEPRNQSAMEYLAALYFWWRDPARELWARRDDARDWYARLAELNFQHRFAHYACGVIDYDEAIAAIRSTPGFPRPPADDESLRSLRAKAGPLLVKSAANFLRALEIDANSTDAMTYLGFVKSRQAQLAEMTDDAVRLKTEAAEWHRKVNQIMEARARAAGQLSPPGDTATITFERILGKTAVPPFPPDARRMIPPAPPPPPPPPAVRP